MDGGPPGNTWCRRLLTIFLNIFVDATDDSGGKKNVIQCSRIMCAHARSLRAQTDAIAVMVSLFSKMPYPQPNIEIRKPNKELKPTLISVTICSLIFFICKLFAKSSEGHSGLKGKLVVARVTKSKN